MTYSIVDDLASPRAGDGASTSVTVGVDQPPSCCGQEVVNTELEGLVLRHMSLSTRIVTLMNQLNTAGATGASGPDREAMSDEPPSRVCAERDTDAAGGRSATPETLGMMLQLV